MFSKPVGYSQSFGEWWQSWDSPETGGCTKFNEGVGILCILLETKTIGLGTTTCVGASVEGCIGTGVGVSGVAVQAKAISTMSASDMEDR